MKAFYSDNLKSFVDTNNNEILGSLTQSSGLSGFQQLQHKQTLSWTKEIEQLKMAVNSLDNKTILNTNNGILLEYPIARRSKRIDVVLILNGLIVVLEYKAGANKFNSYDEEQLLDYCLDIRDFHKESYNKKVLPVLFVPEVEVSSSGNQNISETILPVQKVNNNELGNVLKSASELVNNINEINYLEWEKSDYSPTPTIIEAAQVLYAGKMVEEISRSHAGTKNLTKTSDAIVTAIQNAKNNNQKIICFITGVPGAGKTLAGLNIAHHPDLQNNDGSLATFLSGNAPLIKVLREALARDAYERKKKKEKTTKKNEQARVVAFIENVHRFIEHYFEEKDIAPNNKVVIFDEAQRAWNIEQSKRKFNRSHSEPEIMLDVMDRHNDWAVIVCLVGGGQEINTGEAGLREWGNNLLERFQHWRVYVSPQLKMGNHSSVGSTLFASNPNNIQVIENEDLHLDVSIRSYKAEELSNWVSLLLLNNPKEARRVFQEYLTDYKIYITRDLHDEKDWLKKQCIGTRRMGLVASSGARRLLAEGLDVKADIDAANWFLNPRNDVRSSYYLELIATEFSIQGLELDWIGVCWGLDLRRINSKWDFKSFNGTDWQNVNNKEKKEYIINKYRVLLTRAREGMIIYIPKGNKDDYTRPPEEYDKIYCYLKDCGVPDL